MMNQVAKIILASTSPRRADLIQQIGFHPIIRSVDIDESVHGGEAATDYCLRMAHEKSIAAIDAVQTELPILTADTIVVANDEILGKPKDTSQAVLTLIKLSGRTHQVYSAVCVHYGGVTSSRLSRNDVKMAQVDRALIEAYVATGDPMDKAGAYGIQGYAAMWIECIKGSYSSIMGLPLFETTAILNELNIPLPLNGDGK